MKEVLSVGFILVHLLATTVWLGGIMFILLVAIPSARKAVGEDAGKVMVEVTRRFTPLANVSILLLLLSGFSLLMIAGGFSDMLLSGRNVAIVFKFLLFLLMAAVHFYRGKVLALRIARTPPEQGKANLQKLSLNLVKANLVAGVTVLLFSAVMG